MINSQELATLFLQIQENICSALNAEDTQAKFITDKWQNKQNYGHTRILKNGSTFEQAGVNFSHVKGNELPASASTRKPELAGSAYEAMGVSLVVHPQNPYLPTSHANIRLFIAYPKDSNQEPVWWFGGGFDLTPCYPYLEDVQHWHQVAHDLCEPYGSDVYTNYKQWCDEYFYLPHRQETRGIGGLFFDDLNQWPFEKCLQFIQDVANGYLQAYLPIIQQRKDIPFTERERDFQLYRRGRYIEFNLVWDRGTLFGLQSGGRTESILMSLPPLARFEYQYQIDPTSPEGKLATFLQPQKWLQQ